MKKRLTSFNVQELERIMNKLGAVPRIFNSEAQFQFELAWKIKEEFDCEVKLEPLSRNYTVQRVRNGCTKPYTKNDYTDIILEKDDLRIAIELKYKTAEYKDESQNIFLKAHGAADLGAYDFMWDVHRIQLLTGMETSAAGEVKCPCDRGYAIILTNDAYYWNRKNPGKTINREFLIGGDPCGELNEGTHEWWDKEENRGNLPPAIQNSSSRRDPIRMCETYSYQWLQYYNAKGKTNGDFKYMIVEVTKNGTKGDSPEAIVSMKETIVVEIAKHIEKKYGFRWIKCVDLAMSASWWFKDYTVDELTAIDIDGLVAEVFKQIDNDEIQ